MALTRRDLLLGAGLVALAGGWQVWGVRRPHIAFRAIDTAQGWQSAVAGEISGAANPALVGITGADQPAFAPFSMRDLERAVYGDTRRAGHVPVAVFSDFFCPFCRVLFARLSERLGQDGPKITVAWHELPLLGPSSHFAARAAEAAALQGAYVPFMEALIREGVRPVPAAMGRLADQIGLDGARLVVDMEGPEVAARLHSTARAADQLGVFATPGLVIGKRVVIGALQRPAMEDLLIDTPAHG